MPDITAICHFCGSDYEYDGTFSVDDDFGVCEYCTDETCKHCSVKDDLCFHPECLTDKRDADAEESEAEDAESDEQD